MSLFHSLSFVGKQHEVGDVHTFFFARPAGMKHDAGKHALFLLPGLYRPHPFSISSGPDEEYIAITTHTATGSRYKKRLLDMQAGDSMWLVGPVMNFTFQKRAMHYVFLAQGIGVTPFRSMLVYARTHLREAQITLVHVDSGDHIFKDVTEQMATKAYYPVGAAAFRSIVADLDSSQLFYISGSPKFVSEAKRILRSQGVEEPYIITDSFLGY